MKKNYFLENDEKGEKKTISLPLKIKNIYGD